ncbi:MAG TPA: alkaline phosphatase family protein [Planctomycetota bacterium]
MPSRASKVLVLAIDSLNLEAVRPHLDGGRMPNLARLMSGGVSGILQSTTPAHTAPAWTTLATGKHPGIHGLVNFRRFDRHTQQTRLNNAADVPHKTVWQVLDGNGLRVGVVGQPQSYPARELKNGFVVTGFETPSTQCDFTWPRELKDEILRAVPGFCFRSERVRDPAAGKDWAQWDDFAAGMDSLSQENERAHALNVYLAKSRPWDVLFVYYQATDALFHKAWQWCDPQTRDSDPRRAARIDAFFARLDEMLGELVSLPQAKDALVLGCSDHGHGPARELVRVNGLLAELGFLKRGGLLSQAGAAWRRVTGQRREKGMGIAVDWSGTRAYMPFEAIAGFVYLNRKGHEASGIVGDEQVEALTVELREKLAAQKSPHTGQPLFDSLKTPAEVYGTRCSEEFPELYALPARGVNFVRKLSFGPSVEISTEPHRGTHRPEGFLLLHGAGALSGKAGIASIADVAPTICAALGQPVPSDMTGRVLSELFADGLSETKGPPAALNSEGGAKVYSESERALVEQRLADLGYVE